MVRTRTYRKTSLLLEKTKIRQKYIVKNLAPWMMDELLAFSEFVQYDLILLREQKDFYSSGLKELEKKGIRIYTKPFVEGYGLKKIKIAFFFTIKNIMNFYPGFNSAIGVKGVLWFLRMDLNLFDQDSKIHAQFATQATMVAQLIREYFDQKPEYSFTFHAHDIYFKNKWFNGMLKNCKYAFSISEYNINYVKENFESSKKIILSRLGVFLDQVERKEKKDNSNLLKLGLISWFMPKKGIIYLLEAVRKLHDSGQTDFKLILAGDGPLKNEILDFIKKHDLTSTIEYLGPLDNEQKKKFFNDLDVFVLPSISLENDQDGIPVVLMEAIAYGLPLISTDVSGIPEICIDNYNGLLIQEKKSDEIVEAIKKLMYDKELLYKFSLNSIDLSSKYDIRINSQDKVELLHWL